MPVLSLQEGSELQLLVLSVSTVVSARWIWANDGLKALRKLEKIKLDLIISDIMVPYLDGLQILKKIKKKDELKDIPVIMLTSKSQEKDVLIGLELGAQDYITKPFSPAELILRVNKVLRSK
jgi:DNA-binding response OmpR family regulator